MLLRPFLLSASMLSIVALANGGGDFTRTCFDLTLLRGATGNMNFLKAACVETEGYGSPSHNSTLDLNLCLGLDQQTGALIWTPYGKYTNYCESCTMEKPVKFTCSCTTQGGFENNSTIDLNDGVKNSNGTLSCIGGRGN